MKSRGTGTFVPKPASMLYSNKSLRESQYIFVNSVEKSLAAYL